MGKFDFSVFYPKYPDLIESMPDEFSSHRFILKLAQENQVEYVNALYAYRYSESGDEGKPFQVVHGLLAKGLRQFPDMVEYVKEISNIDIFGQSNSAAWWLKL